MNRQAFFANSKAEWDASLAGKFDGRIVATELTTLFYITSKQKDKLSRNAGSNRLRCESRASDFAVRFHFAVNAVTEF